jgi:hypothetical protein
MLHIYGDSHAYFSFKNLSVIHKNNYHFSVTMFRIGRDNIIINFNNNEIKSNDVIVLAYGEVDCRCHIQRQIDTGKNEDDIIYELVSTYFKTIKSNINNDTIKIIVVGVISPTKQNDYEIIHGPILDEFPFLGKDEDRVRYTNKVNNLLEELSYKYGYTYFNPYSYYTRPDGTLKHELSDSNVHLGDNSFFLEKFTELYNKFV